MTDSAPKYSVDFPTLWVVPAWHERHCVIPDGFRKGTPWRHYDWQLWITVNHYRVKHDAVAYQPYEELQDDGTSETIWVPSRASAFFYRRSQVIGPQKTGKGPFTAVLTAGEGCGPVLFAGWAVAGDVYRCEDHGCSCGWVYAYKPGEPRGMPWTTPLIQLLATSEDQVDNVYRPLQAMARGPFLSELMQVREGFIRLPNDGRIDVVTSSAQSRLGNPTTFTPQDETGLYTVTNKMVRVAETMRRGTAGMGGRSIETTNPYDPTEQSVAQRTHEAKAEDVFKFYEPPPANLRWKVKAERRKILEFNYAGSPHVPIDAIEAEANELSELDPAQAERFYGNRIVAGSDAWTDVEKWNARSHPVPQPPAKTQVVLGFDGSDIDDWTGIRAETQSGYQFTPVTDAGPTVWAPADFDGQVPRTEVAAAVDWLFKHFDVVRFYCDPPYWQTEIDGWAAKYGEKRVVPWYTSRPRQMTAAAERLLTDAAKADSGFTHDGCPHTESHVGNARKIQRPGAAYYKLSKPSDGRKIDMAVVSILAHEAAGDATAGKLWRRRYSAYAD